MFQIELDFRDSPGPLYELVRQAVRFELRDTLHKDKELILHGFSVHKGAPDFTTRLPKLMHDIYPLH